MDKTIIANKVNFRIEWIESDNHYCASIEGYPYWFCRTDSNPAKALQELVKFKEEDEAKSGSICLDCKGQGRKREWYTQRKSAEVDCPSCNGKGRK